MGSGQSKVPEAPSYFPPPAQGAGGQDLPSGSAKSSQKPKPCCVCLDEKAKRDECMLFSKSDNAQQECADLVQAYKKCMEGYGFKV